MELRQISYFVRVAELGSFSRAAVTLNIAQSAISRQVRKLEEELGVQLLYRNGRGVTMTHAGALLLEHGRSAVESLEHVSHELSLLRTSPGGSAVIGIPPTVGRMFTIPFARRFRLAFPQVNLRIVEGFSGHLLEWLFAGRVDVAVLYDDPAAYSAIFEPIVEEDLACIGKSGVPPPLTDGAVTLSALCQLPLVLPSRPHGLRTYLDSITGKMGLTLPVALEVDALHSMLEAVREDFGYAILPLMAIQRELSGSGLSAWPVTEPQLTRLIYVATASQRARAAPMRQVAQLVRAQILDLIPEAGWRVARRPTIEPQQADAPYSLGADGPVEPLP